MSTLSIAIIMKNEEAVVERCLTCVSKFAEEVILVDTGSTDKTKELAAKFPKVQVFDSAFFNKDTHFSDFEFGKAKNEAIRRCTKDWVMWFDADDLMDDENIAKVREIVDNETRTCLYSFRISYGPLRFEHCRLLKNHAKILFDEDHGCHEYLNTLGNPLIIRNDVVIQHLPEHKGVSSQARNLAIMEKDYYVRGRKDQRTLFYLANAYREETQLEKAIEFYDKYLEVSKWREERFFARYYKAQCQFRTGRTDESCEEIIKSMAEDFRFAEAFCFMGDIMFHKGEFERAILWFKLAMATPYPQDARLFVSQYSYSDYPSKRITDCIAKMGPTAAPADSTTETVQSPPQIRKEKYFLPADRGLAMLAVKALSNCIVSTMEKEKPTLEIEVIPTDDFQAALVSSFETLRVGTGEGKSLSLPKNLKGKHAQEWFVRSAGFIGVKMEPVRIANAVERAKNIIVVDSSLQDREAVMRKLQDAGLEYVVLEDSATFKEALVLYKQAAAFIGTVGWKQHLAEWTAVSSLIFFDGHDPKEYGWADQQNQNVGDFSGFEDFLKRSLA